MGDSIITKKSIINEQAESASVWIQSNVTSNLISGICYGNGLWVAGGGNNNVTNLPLYYSTDGKIWNQSNVTGYFSNIWYANGVWIAAKSGGGLYYSTNGKTWTSAYSSNVSFTTAAYGGNGVWVASGSSVALYYSNNNGTSFGTQGMSGTFYAVHYANGMWVTGSIGKGLYYSTDGIDWNQSNITSDSFMSGQPIYYADGVWVAGSAVGSGLYYSTTNGKTWTQSNITSDGFIYVYNADGIWIALGSSKGLYYSIDNGKNWIQSNVTSGYGYSVCKVGGTWLATTGSLYRSSDGKTWTQITIPDATTYRTMCNGNSVCVIATSNGLYYSES